MIEGSRAFSIGARAFALIRAAGYTARVLP